MIFTLEPRKESFLRTKERYTSRLLESASLYTRFKDVQNAVLSLESCVYFVSVSLLFLYLTTLILRARRWQKK